MASPAWTESLAKKAGKTSKGRSFRTARDTMEAAISTVAPPGTGRLMSNQMARTLADQTRTPSASPEIDDASLRNARARAVDNYDVAEEIFSEIVSPTDSQAYATAEGHAKTMGDSTIATLQKLKQEAEATGDRRKLRSLMDYISSLQDWRGVRR
jgi:hypothetical protein